MNTPNPVLEKLHAIVDKASELLKGEAARAIGYGAAVVIFVVANVLDVIPDMTIDQALSAALAAIVTVASVIESIRHFVYSENTVVRIAANAAETGDSSIPPPPSNSADIK